MSRALSSVSSTSDLAIAAAGPGVTMMWTDRDRAVRSTDIANNTEQVVIGGPIDGIGGIERTSAGTLVVTYTGALQTLWLWDGTTASSLYTESTVAGRGEPFANDETGVPRAWLRGEAGGVRASFVSDSGTKGSDVVFPTSAPVTALSAAVTTQHGHAAWSEDRGGGTSVCLQADIDFPNGIAPTQGSTGMSAPDCFDPRIDSGPGPTDSIATVYRTGTGEVWMRYLGGVPDATQRLSSAGRAPKIRFDQTWFWVAWIDLSGGAEVLRVAKVAQDLTFTTVDLPGWYPASDEAFELVRQTDGRIYLGLISNDSISLLQTCP